MPEKKPQNAWEQVGRYTSLAFLLPAATFAGYACGYLLDRWLGTKFLHRGLPSARNRWRLCPVHPTSSEGEQP